MNYLIYGINRMLPRVMLVLAGTAIGLLFVGIILAGSK